MGTCMQRLLGGTVVLLALLGGAGAAYLRSLDLASQPLADPGTVPGQLAMLQGERQQFRGRILAVVTSTAKSGEVAAGLELTELSRAYYTFIANGFEVEIASPMGGRPPVRMDDELIDVDYAFLNDADAQERLSNTLALAQVDPSRYSAVYFVGGKGPMFDFAGNPDVRRVAASIHDAGGVVGAVCHGPAALIDVTLASGQKLLAGRRVTGFTNEEELFLIRNAREVFPFLLEDVLTAQAGVFSKGPKYLDHTVVDGRLVTGQNPWSTWSVAEGMIRALGFEPVARESTREERAVAVLAAFHRDGATAAAAVRDGMGSVDKRLVLMHALLATMEGRLGEAYRLQQLAH
ncbi:type 1 glutamine amidotransferase domain-containing protein [Lysobacter sp. A3-1-A15]|uniref:type 1 glutamine amidotransferase domain-containing protein n=1 Tax=Novilysobacter viscosus TaxID=3098602 RepID=UPI002ED92BB2